MSTDTELHDALRRLNLTASAVPAHVDRSAGFADFAHAVGRGGVATPPYLLTGRRRRQYIRDTVLEDHRRRMHVVPEAVAGKLRDIAADPFSFFRGTALLYFRDIAGTDSHLKTIPCVGDLHPENFGILPGAEGHPLFSANDFDEAWPAPFSWDVQRGAVGFAMQTFASGFGPKKRRKVARDYIRGYTDGVEECLADPDAARTSIREDNAPDCLVPFFRKADRSRKKFLKKRIDSDAEAGTVTFTETDRVTRRPELTDTLRPVVRRYADNIAPKYRPENFFEVRDVAVRTGSGTASRGLPRFWVLVEGWGPAAQDKVIIELKLSRHSVMKGLVPTPQDSPYTEAERTAQAFDLFVIDGDPLYGHVDISGLDFLVRERSPMKVNVDASSFDYHELREYAQVCGVQTAHLHARAQGDQDNGALDHVSRQIHADVFISDTETFVEDTVRQVIEDHRLFCEDLELGAFDTIGTFDL